MPGVLIVEPQVVPLSPHASRFLISMQVAGWTARVYILLLLLRPVVLRKRQEAPKGTVQRIFAKYGAHATAAFAVQPDKHHVLLADGRGLAAYAVKGAVAIACGDPMASTEDFLQSLQLLPSIVSATVGRQASTSLARSGCRPIIR